MTSSRCACVDCLVRAHAWLGPFPCEQVRRIWLVFRLSGFSVFLFKISFNLWCKSRTHSWIMLKYLRFCKLTFCPGASAGGETRFSLRAACGRRGQHGWLLVRTAGRRVIYFLCLRDKTGNGGVCSLPSAGSVSRCYPGFPPRGE